MGQRLKVPGYAGLKKVTLEQPGVGQQGGMESFDADFSPLYQAVENANSHEVSDFVDQLLNYCNGAIDTALAWLTSDDSQAEPRAQIKFGVADRSWQRFLTDSEEAVEWMMMPICGTYAGGNAFEQGKGLAKADLLRGRYAQLNRMIGMQKTFTENEQSTANDTG